ncbi:hypothetical protein EBB59_03835 [Lysobacter pythonis]|uniref:Uncharacterized protein n=1 Tax=Solilutibacter pythonis TaxID=2483112 RepID=A0A3M2I065_9GAMM|nr:hypothetical protein [Lysobacter pythonis]RMH93785.1 hypothetical protein EBB59_03835 [Lysobacter pythonis]
MKVQLTDKALRWRIDERELAALLAGDPVSLAPCAGALGLACLLALSDDDTPRFDPTAGRWSLRLPRALVEAHVATLPSREGVRVDIGALSFLFEVDVRESVRAGRSRAPAR